MNFHNTSAVITVKNSSGTIIDATSAGCWTAGINSLAKQSMERNSIPGDGAIAGNWNLCISAGCNDKICKDIEGENYGTPKEANLQRMIFHSSSHHLLFRRFLRKRTPNQPYPSTLLKIAALWGLQLHKLRHMIV